MASYKSSTPSGPSSNIDYSKYSHWDRSQAMVRFEPVSSKPCCECSSTPKRKEEIAYISYEPSVCRYQTTSCSCDCERRSRRSSKRRHRSSSSRHSCSSRHGHYQSARHHTRHCIPIDQNRPRELSRVASARQSSFSVLSQSSAAVLSDQQRRQRSTNKSDETEAQKLATLKNALSKVGRRSAVPSDRKSLRRSAVTDQSQQSRSSKGASEDDSQETSKTAENESALAPIIISSSSADSRDKTEMVPVLSGFVHQQPRIRVFWPEKKRFMVLRQTCLEIYADESAYNTGMAKSCILLVGANLQILNGNKFKIDSCSRSKLFRIRTDDEHRRWTQGIEKTISQLASKSV